MTNNKIKETNMLEYYKKELIRLLRTGRAKMEAAPIRRGYVLGRQIPSKRDCQAAMVQDIRALFNEAELLKVDLSKFMDKPEEVPEANPLLGEE